MNTIEVSVSTSKTVNTPLAMKLIAIIIVIIIQFSQGLKQVLDIEPSKTEIDIETETEIEKKSTPLIKTEIKILKNKCRYPKPESNLEKIFSGSILVINTRTRPNDNRHNLSHYGKLSLFAANLIFPPSKCLLIYFLCTVRIPVR